MTASKLGLCSIRAVRVQHYLKIRTGNGGAIFSKGSRTRAKTTCPLPPKLRSSGPDYNSTRNDPVKDGNWKEIFEIISFSHQ